MSAAHVEGLSGALSTGPRGGGTKLTYLPGLDGLRALAVLAVLLYHADVPWIPGGFLGVEVFFVISGFLITSLLLSEYRRTGSVDLLGFWVRRARRLLPAVFLMIAVTLTFAVIFLPEEVAGLRSDALAAVGYVTNWYMIFVNESYFEAVGRPSLLKHLWSLAVEEQFYLVWPIVMGIGLMVFRRGGVFVLSVVGAVASAALMIYLYQPGVDPSRVYYGTDTRAAGLLLGAALAFVWTPGKGYNSPNGRRSVTAGGRLRRKFGWTSPLALDLVGLASLGTLVWLSLSVGEYDAFLYRGGLALVAAATVIVIAAVAHPHAHLGMVLGLPFMRWIGVRSYGIYLWHWPVFMVTRPGLDVSVEGLPLLAVRLVATVVLADMSYRYVETPIRRGSLGKAIRDLREARGPRRRRLGVQWTAAGVACVALFAVLGSNMVNAKSPDRPDFLPTEAIQAEVTGVDEEPEATESAGETESAKAPEETASEETSASTDEKPEVQKDEKPVEEPEKKEEPDTEQASVEPAPDGLITAVGDSVMLGASKQLEKRIPDFQVTDAATGMQVADAIQILEARKASGELGNTVLLQIGTNGTFTEEEFDEIMSILSDTERVVFVNLRVPRSWEASNNEVITDGVAEYPERASYVDWHAASEGHYEYFWDDGIHTRPKGSAVYADLIAEHLGR